MSCVIYLIRIWNSVGRIPASILLVNRFLISECCVNITNPTLDRPDTCLHTRMSHIIMSTEHSMESNNKCNRSRVEGLHFIFMVRVSSGESDRLLAHLVEKSLNFIPPQGSLLFPQKHMFGHYNVPVEFSPNSDSVFLLRFILITYLRTEWCLPCEFSAISSCALLVSVMWNSWIVHLILLGFMLHEKCR
jgi:hypothetical protein